MNLDHSFSIKSILREVLTNLACETRQCSHIYYQMTSRYQLLQVNIYEYLVAMSKLESMDDTSKTKISPDLESINRKV